MKNRLLYVILLIMLLIPVLSLAENELTLFAINVRKADCLLLMSGDDVYMIDTGTKYSWGQVSAALRTYGITHLNGVIVTHTDQDHAGGAAILASTDIQIDAWYAPQYYTGKESKHPVIKAAAARGQQVTWLSSGDELPLSGGSLRVLGPLQSSELENCNSIVLLAETDDGTILLTGDMQFPEENDLLAAGLIPQCTVLKVGNHGESDATSEGLMRAVKPLVSVISTNTEDEHDTPAARVMKLLMKYSRDIAVTQNAEAGILVTVRNGDAEVQLMSWDAPEQMSGLTISEKNVSKQYVTITNTSSDSLDLSGCYILSERGGEIFVFPQGTALAGGASITIACEDSKIEGDLTWPDEKVWHKSKSDAAVLYDPYGRELDRLE